MKILFLQEYIRVNHVLVQDTGTVNIFLKTDLGKKLVQKLKSVGITKQDFYIDYAYAKIPEPKKQVNGKILTYKEPTAQEKKEPQTLLTERIIQEKPDLIVPMGNIGCKYLLNVASIRSLRGIPEKVTLQSEQTGEKFTPWVMPMYSMEYLISSPNVEGMFDADLTTLSRYKTQGDEAFTPAEVSYELVTSLDRVKDIFEKEVRNHPVIAWDLETNTLLPEMLGAKPLVMSVSWKEGQGVTIPLEHRESHWEDHELEEVYNYIREFVADKNIIKVGHNIQYDIRFLMSSKGFIKFNNNRDTKIGYYLSVTQQIEDSFKLSDLAYEMTDMGGYDKPLADFKKKYIKDYNDKKTAEQEERKKKIVEEINKQFVEETLKFKEDTKKYNEEKANNTYSVLVKPVKPKKGKAPTKAELAYEPLANEVDGGNFNYDWIPLEILHPYASGDTDCCLRIHNVLTEIIAKNQKMWFQFANFYPSAIVALARIESNGIYAQTDYMEDINEKYTEEEERLVEEMRKIAEVSELEEQHMELYERGVEEMAIPPAKRDKDIAKLRDKYKKKLKFNPNSATDKGKVLYQIMGITLPYDKEHIKESAFDVGKPENKLTWEDYKTDKKALNYIVDHFPDQKAFASLLLEHSLVKTRKNNFTAKLLNFISNKDGRVHGSFNATGTETTRLSSNNPNMQQLPAKTSNPKRFDYQYPIKRMFQTAFENGALLQLDYSSLEMRILALAAGDEAMTQAFFDGADLHKETASIVWGMPVDKVPAEFRKKAKAVNFGIAYGETPFSFAPKHDMSVEEAEDIFQRYFANKPNIKTFIDETHREALRDGFVDTLQGHRRLIRDAFSKDKQIQNGALRKSVNTKIQGTGAYCTNMSLIYIDQYIQDNNMKSKLVLTVHDSIVVDCPPEEIEIMARVCKTIMENLPIDFLSIEWKGEKTKYPIEADIEIGTNYNDMVEYNPSELKEFSSLTGYVKYYKDLGKISDYMEAGIITEESMDLGQTRIKESKEIYKKIA